MPVSSVSGQGLMFGVEEDLETVERRLVEKLVTTAATPNYCGLPDGLWLLKEYNPWQHNINIDRERWAEEERILDNIYFPAGTWLVHARGNKTQLTTPGSITEQWGNNAIESSLLCFLQERDGGWWSLTPPPSQLYKRRRRRREITL